MDPRHFIAAKRASTAYTYALITGLLAIAVIAMLTRVGGDVARSFGGDALALVDATPTPMTGAESQVRVLNVTLPPDGVYGSGQTLRFELSFSADVVVSQPLSLALTIGDGASAQQVQAFQDQAPGTLRHLSFSYTVAPDLVDTTGIRVNPVLQQHGAPLLDTGGRDVYPVLSMSAADTEGVRIDSTRVFLATIEAPADGFYGEGSTLRFGAVFNGRVTVEVRPPANSAAPTLPVVIGGQTYDAAYFGLSTNSLGQSVLHFELAVVAPMNAADGITLGAALDDTTAIIRSQGGEELSDLRVPATALNAVIVDTIAPDISGVALAGDMLLMVGEDLSAEVTFTEPVQVNQSGPDPARMLVAVDSVTDPSVVPARGYPRVTTPPSATMTGQEGATVFFSTSPRAGDMDLDGLGLVAPGSALIGGTIVDRAGNAFDGDMTVLHDALSTRRIDTNAPRVSAISAPAVTYFTGEQVQFTLTFNEPVLADRATLALGFDLDAGTEAPIAQNALKSGFVSDLTLLYTVASGDFDDTGLALGTLANSLTATRDDGQPAFTDAAGNPLVTDLTGVASNIAATSVNGRLPMVKAPLNDQQGVASIALAIDVPAETFGGTDLMLTLTDAPDWLTLDADRRQLSGRPPAASAHQSFTVTLRASNDYGQASDSFQLDIGAFRDCVDALDNGITASGVIAIDPDGAGPDAPFETLCEQSTVGGGWTLVAAARDGSLYENTAVSCGSVVGGDCVEAVDFAARDAALVAGFAPFRGASAVGDVGGGGGSDIRTPAITRVGFSQMLFMTPSGDFLVLNAAGSSVADFLDSEAGRAQMREYAATVTNISTAQNPCDTLTVAFVGMDSSRPPEDADHVRRVGPVFRHYADGGCPYGSAGLSWTQGRLGGSNAGIASSIDWYVRDASNAGASVFDDAPSWGPLRQLGPWVMHGEASGSVSDASDAGGPPSYVRVGIDVDEFTTLPTVSVSLTGVISGTLSDLNKGFGHVEPVQAQLDVAAEDGAGLRTVARYPVVVEPPSSP